MDEVERRLEVDPDDAVPLLLAHPQHQAVARDAGVVDQDVDVAELSLDFIDHGMRLLEIGCIGSVGPGLVAVGLDLGERLLRRFVDDQIREGDIRAFGSKTQGDRLSYSPRGARYQRHFVVQKSHNYLFITASTSSGAIGRRFGPSRRAPSVVTSTSSSRRIPPKL